MFEIKSHPKVKRDLKRLSKNERTIFLRILDKLKIDPVVFGKPLHKSLKNHRSIRLGKQRVVYSIKNKIVTIWAVDHREEIYEKSEKRIGL